MITMTSTESDMYVVFQRSSCDAVPGRKAAIDLIKVRIPKLIEILSYSDFPLLRLRNLLYAYETRPLERGWQCSLRDAFQYC